MNRGVFRPRSLLEHAIGRKGECDTMIGFGLLFVILAVVATVWGLGWLQREGQLPGSSGSQRSRKKPLDILQERYAQGEISKAEYDQIREDLRV